MTLNIHHIVELQACFKDDKNEALKLIFDVLDPANKYDLGGWAAHILDRWDDAEWSAMPSTHRRWALVDFVAFAQQLIAEETALTWDRFVATRKQHVDLREALTHTDLGTDFPVPGFTYLDGTLYIEEITADWPAGAIKYGDKYCLTIDRDIAASKDLEPLERKLYAWALTEGYKAP
jgi:hypothetical protein